MEQNELFSYVYDFISGLIDNREIFGNIKKIILFGSIIRGDFNEKSDVDIFIDVPEGDIKGINDLNKVVKKEINKFDERANKNWKIRGIKSPINAITGNLEEDRWKELKDEIIEHGIVLYDKFRENPESLKHKVLLSYEMGKLPQDKKMAFRRRLYGYKIKKGKKEYIQKGLIENIKGEKFDSNSIILDAEKVLKLKKLLKEYRINFKVKSVWIK